MLSKSITTNKYYRKGAEITETEYNNILEIIVNKPIAPDGYGYKLTDSLEWELYELPTEETDEEITDEEALSTITGGAI